MLVITPAWRHARQKTAATHLKYATRLIRAPLRLIGYKRSPIPTLVDVSALHEDENGLFFNIPGTTVSLDPKSTIGDFQMQLYERQKYLGVHFYSPEKIKYASSTPIEFVVANDFYFEYNTRSVFVTRLEKQFTYSFNYQRYNRSYMSLWEYLGHPVHQKQTLQMFVSQFLHHLNSSKTRVIDQNRLCLVARSLMNQIAIAKHCSMEDYAVFLQILREKRHRLLEQKAKIEDLAQRKARRSLNCLLAFYLAQAALLQYGTYFAYSWDIIEPITNLCGILDVTLAYAYWLRTHKKFNWKSMYENKIQYFVKRIQFNKRFDQTELDEVDELIKMFERQAAIDSAYHGTSNVADKISQVSQN